MYVMFLEGITKGGTLNMDRLAISVLRKESYDSGDYDQLINRQNQNDELSVP